MKTKKLKNFQIAEKISVKRAIKFFFLQTYIALLHFKPQ